jgi:hypothetical protein
MEMLLHERTAAELADRRRSLLPACGLQEERHGTVLRESAVRCLTHHRPARDLRSSSRYLLPATCYLLPATC